MSRLIWPKIDGVIKDLALLHPKIWGMPDGPSLITFYWVIRSGWFLIWVSLISALTNNICASLIGINLVELIMIELEVPFPRLFLTFFFGYFWRFPGYFRQFFLLFLTFFSTIFDVSPAIFDVFFGYFWRFFSAIFNVFQAIFEVFFGYFWRFPGYFRQFFLLFLTFFSTIFDVSPAIFDVFFGCFWRFFRRFLTFFRLFFGDFFG